MVYLSPTSETAWDGFCGSSCPFDNPCALPRNGTVSMRPLGHCSIVLSAGNYDSSMVLKSPSHYIGKLTIFVNESVSNLDLDISGIDSFLLASSDPETQALLSTSHISLTPSGSDGIDTLPVNINSLITTDVTFAIAGTHSQRTYAQISVANTSMTITSQGAASLQQRASELNSTILDSVFNIIASSSIGQTLDGNMELSFKNSTLVMPKSRTIGVLRSSSLAISSVTVSSFSGLYHSRHIVYASASGGTSLTLADSSEITGFTNVFDGEIDAENWTTSLANNITTVGSNNIISGKTIPMDRSPKSVSSSHDNTDAEDQDLSQYGALFSHEDACVGLDISSSTVAWVSISCPLDMNDPNSLKSSCPVNLVDSQLFDNRLCWAFGFGSPKLSFDSVQIFMDSPESFVTMARTYVEAANLTILNRTVLVDENPSAAFSLQNVYFTDSSNVITNTLSVTGVASISNLELLEDAIVTLHHSSVLTPYVNLAGRTYHWDIHPGLILRGTNRTGVDLPAGRMDLSRAALILTIWPTIDVADGSPMWSAYDNTIVYLTSLEAFGRRSRIMWNEITVGIAPVPNTLYKLGLIDHTDSYYRQYPIMNATGGFEQFRIQKKIGDRFDDLFFSLPNAPTTPPIYINPAPINPSPINPSPIDPSPVSEEPQDVAPVWKAPGTDQCRGRIQMNNFRCWEGKWIYDGNSGFGVGLLALNSTLVIDSPSEEELQAHPDAMTIVSLASFAFAEEGTLRIKGLRVKIELSMCYPTNYMSTNGMPTERLTDETFKIDLESPPWPSSTTSWTFVQEGGYCSSRTYPIPFLALNPPVPGTSSKCEVRRIDRPALGAANLTISFVNDRSKCNKIIAIAVGVSVGAAIAIIVGIIIFCKCRSKKSEEGYTAIN